MEDKKRLIRFLVDSKDEDLEVGVCTEGVVEKVDVCENGIWLYRWCVKNNEEVPYFLPLSEEGKMFMFID